MVHSDRFANALTVEVEDWFHILDGFGSPDRDAWASLPSRIEHNLDRLLELLARCEVRATMFWLGWAAGRYPALVRRCYEMGHEIASHGHEHLPVHLMGKKRFAEDVSRSKSLLEDIVGTRVQGIRVPGLALLGTRGWAYQELARAGYAYSSSLSLTQSGLGLAAASARPQVIETAAGPIRELPLNTIGALGIQLRLFGDACLRVLPWPVLLGSSLLLNFFGEPVIYHLRPRDLDAEGPRMKNLPWHRYLASYVNLESTPRKLQRLLSAQGFVPLQDWL